MEAYNKRKINKIDFEKELKNKYGIIESAFIDNFNNEKHSIERVFIYYKNNVHIASYDESKKLGWELKKD